MDWSSTISGVLDPSADGAVAYRGEYKTVGGKLVAVTVDMDAESNVRGVSLDGDFFIDGGDSAAQELLHDMAEALVQGRNLDDVIAAHPQARLIGTDAQAVRTAFRRAVDKARDSGGDAGDAGGSGVGHMNSAPGAADTDMPVHVRSDVQGDARSLHDAAVADVSATAGASAAASSAGDGDATQYRDRWHALAPRILLDKPRGPQEQVDLDVELAQRVAAGQMPATVRFWQLSSPAVIVGRYQSVADEVHEREAEQAGFQVVRRSTGGGVMVANPPDIIVYSLYAPLSFVSGLDVAHSYRLCDQWALDALRSLGLSVGFGGMNDIVSPRGKVGGAAQRRFASHGEQPGAVLHHTMLSWGADTELMGALLNVSAEKMSDKAVRSAHSRVDPLRSQTALSRDEIRAQLVSYAGSAI